MTALAQKMPKAAGTYASQAHYQHMASSQQLKVIVSDEQSSSVSPVFHVESIKCVKLANILSFNSFRGRFNNSAAFT